MMPFTVSYYGNPHSRTHAYGWESEQAVEKARQVGFYCLFNKKNMRTTIPDIKVETL